MHTHVLIAHVKRGAPSLRGVLEVYFSSFSLNTAWCFAERAVISH